jgi:hypothetical protein
LRPAGALAGVALERYLKGICIRNKTNFGKLKPKMAHYNEALKSSGLIGPELWRNIQYLGDIRNCCDHPGREPRADEVEYLISETGKIISMDIL